MGGIETYVRRLVPALLDLRPSLDLSLFVNEVGKRALSGEPWTDGVNLITHPLLGRRYTRALTELTILGSLASRRKLDVLHSVALTAPLRTRPANVLTIADVTWLRHPDAAERHTMRLWRLIVPPVARAADRVIVLSEDTRREVSEDLRIPLDRIDVVPLGPGGLMDAVPTPEPVLRERLDLGSGPIVLAVSAFKEHKNVGALVEAMAAVRARISDAVLVVPGNPTSLSAELHARAAALGIASGVVFPGWLHDADLEGLYRAAVCFVFPSLREGFGLPVLEAMRRGLPVACGRVSAIPEVAGDAALYFDPREPEQIADAIFSLLGNSQLAGELSAKGLERQKLFSWQRAAELTLDCYERAMASR
jgi:glycosyltransferase involved in cell wall biosynthesis